MLTTVCDSCKKIPKVRKGSSDQQYFTTFTYEIRESTGVRKHVVDVCWNCWPKFEKLISRSRDITPTQPSWTISSPFTQIYPIGGGTAVQNLNSSNNTSITYTAEVEPVAVNECED